MSEPRGISDYLGGREERRTDAEALNERPQEAELGPIARGLATGLGTGLFVLRGLGAVVLFLIRGLGRLLLGLAHLFFGLGWLFDCIVVVLIVACVAWYFFSLVWENFF